MDEEVHGPIELVVLEVVLMAKMLLQLELVVMVVLKLRLELEVMVEEDQVIQDQELMVAKVEPVL